MNMSRENFALELTDKNDTKLMVFVSHIQYVQYDPKEKVTKVVIPSGTLLVKENPEMIITQGEKYGVIRQLK